ncbi:MAG: hypothetical protein ABI903_05230, partial [Actinomycetota bacterium]
EVLAVAAVPEVLAVAAVPEVLAVAAIPDTFLLEFQWAQGVSTSTAAVADPAAVAQTVVPVGGVAAGDGSTAYVGMHRENAVLALALMLLGGVAVLRRRVSFTRK